MYAQVNAESGPVPATAEVDVQPAEVNAESTPVPATAEVEDVQAAPVPATAEVEDVPAEVNAESAPVSATAEVDATAPFKPPNKVHYCINMKVIILYLNIVCMMLHY